MKLKPRQIVVLVLFFIGFVLSLILGGPFFAVAFMLIWTDRVIFSVFELKKSLTIEFSSLPIIMTGAQEGSLVGFIFAFICLLITDPVARFVMGKKPGFLSSVFGFEAIFLMVLAILGGFFSGFLGFMAGTVVTFAAKEFIIILIKGKLFGGADAILTHGMNFAFNTVLFIVLMKVLAGL